MRYFPSGMRQRLLVAALAGVTSLSVAVPLAMADDDLKDKQKQVKQQLSQAHDDLDETSSAVRKATNAVAHAQQRLANARAEVADVRTKVLAAKAKDTRLQAALVAAGAKVDAATAELKDGRQAANQQRKAVQDTVITILTNGDPRLDVFSSYFEAGSPEDLVRRLAAQKAVVGSQASTFETLTGIEEQLAARRAAVRAAKDAVAAQRKAAADNLDTIAALYGQAQVAKQQVDSLVVANRNARRDAQRAKAHDIEILQKLEKREARISAAILEAARRANNNSYNGATDGFLDYPVDGAVTSPFGYRTHPIYGYYGLHNGTDFGADCGQSLYAAASGTVVDEYYDDVYGNRLYLSIGNVNGANLTLIYNHLSSYQVGEGTQVKRGQVLGAVGDTGWATGCHLHFTVLRDGVAVDPMGYF